MHKNTVEESRESNAYLRSRHIPWILSFDRVAEHYRTEPETQICDAWVCFPSSVIPADQA